MANLAYLFLYTWALSLLGSFLAVAFFASSLVQRRDIEHIEYLVLIVPFLFWFALSLTGLAPKSLANIYESLFLGVGISILYTFRIVGNRRIKFAGKLMLVTACVVAITIYIVTPVLPE